VCQPHFDANCFSSEEPSTAATTTADTAIIVAIAATADASRTVAIQSFCQRVAVPAHLK
jgi:hypothetical protein